MFRFIIFAFLGFGLAACASKKKLASPHPVIKFEKSLLDIGQLVQGESKTLFFNFTNTGSTDLMIDLVTACKCTELDWPRSPITPGQKGRIKVVFDSSTIPIGEVIKTVDIIANTDPIVVEAKFKVDVVSS